MNNAIVLQQIHYWVEINKKANKNFVDGKYWTYNTIKQWAEQFSFWSEKTTQRILADLEKRGIIISGVYNSSKFLRTKWYTIDYAKLDSQIKIHLDKKSESTLGQIDQMNLENLTESCKIV